MKNNFLQRTITGVLFVIILIGGILCGPITFRMLFTTISVLCTYEFAHLINRQEDICINPFITAVGGAYLFLAMAGYCTAMSDIRIFIPYLLLLLYLMISELYKKKSNPLGNWAFTTLSQLYIALPFALLNILAYSNVPSENSIAYNPILPLSVFALLWINDTGAYCIGSLIGKHRLFERISPKKSWEGSIGGALFSIAASLVFAHFFPKMDVMEWIGLALVIVVFGTWGDLTESLMKRQLGIKDSGNILPGHGGLLDRFDSALMTIPATTVYMYALTTF